MRSCTRRHDPRCPHLGHEQYFRSRSSADRFYFRWDISQDNRQQTHYRKSTCLQHLVSFTGDSFSTSFIDRKQSLVTEVCVAPLLPAHFSLTRTKPSLHLLFVQRYIPRNMDCCTDRRVYWMRSCQPLLASRAFPWSVKYSVGALETLWVWHRYMRPGTSSVDCTWCVEHCKYDSSQFLHVSGTPLVLLASFWRRNSLDNRYDAASIACTNAHLVADAMAY